MNKTLYVVLLLAIATYFVFLAILLKNKQLNLKYTLLWIFAGVFMLAFSLFPQLLELFSKAVGIYQPTNALFAMMMFFGIIIMMSLTSIVSKMNEKIKQMAQYIALLEKRLRDMEARNGTDRGADT